MNRFLKIPFVFGIILSLGMSADVPSKSYGAESQHHISALTQIMTPEGVADWTNGVVRATGFGFPPKDTANALHAKVMAQRAAHSVALRNLLEALNGVRIDSNTTVKNYIVANDEIQVRVSGMVNRARIVKEQQLPDGSYEVTVEMDLRGDLTSTLVPKAKAKPVKLFTNPPERAPRPKIFSGLVIDARGTGAQPALAPRILDEEGQEAYSVAYVEGKDLADQGIVVYVPDVSSAQAHPRVTSKPLVVKAVRATGTTKADLVISDADAQTIHGVPEHYRFLEKAQVLVVLDTKK
jgi:hypothetical protein